MWFSQPVLAGLIAVVGHGVQGEEVMVWPLSRHSMGMLACASIDWDENGHWSHFLEAIAVFFFSGTRLVRILYTVAVYQRKKKKDN